MPEEYFHPYSARLSAVEAVASLARGEPDVAPRLSKAACLLRSAAKQLDEDAVTLAFEDFGALLDGIAHLANWGRAVRAAEADADRFLRAAKQAARDIQKRITERSQGHSPVLAGLDALGKVTGVDEVEQVARRCMCIPLPIPRTSASPGRALPRIGSPTIEPSEEPAPAVAFLLFSYRNSPVSEPWIVTPNMLYDLSLEVRLSRWPASATRIVFAPIHVEKTEVVEAPVFELRPPPDPAQLTFHPLGRLRVALPQDFLARPLEVHYAAFVERSAAQGSKVSSNEIIVQGHRRLVLQSFDPALNPVSGYREVDERLLTLRDEARAQCVPDDELGRFLTLLAGTGNLASQALASNLYLGNWSEQRFQDDAKSRLRAIPAIGSNLEEQHPHAAGGITDLSFHRIRLELKADHNGGVTVNSALERYGQQTAQYVAGSDRRCGVLMVLDTSKKTVAPGTVQNDIAVRALPPPSGQGRGLVLGVVVVRGNLARPSDLS